MYVWGWERLVYAGGRLECVRVGEGGSRLGCVCMGVGETSVCGRLGKTMREGGLSVFVWGKGEAG